MEDKKLLRYTKRIMLAVFAIWLLFLLIPLIHIMTANEILKGINDVYVMAGALFTGLAFAATYASLLIQNKALKEQLAMDNLSSVINLILASDRFRESRKYVLSKTFCHHVDILKKMKDDDPIYIEDWKKLEMEEMDKESSNSYEDYEKIIYFCGRMEYLGVVLKNKGIDYTVLDYFGNTILESYKRLGTYIENSRARFGETYYYHYTYLNYLATKRESTLKQSCKRLLEKIANNELQIES